MTYPDRGRIRTGGRAAMWIAVLLSACLALLVGCAPANDAPETDETPTADLAHSATLMVEDLAAGDPATMYEAFSETLAGQLTEAQLSDAWQQGVQVAGEFRAVHDVSVREEGGLSVAEVIVDGEKQGLTVTLSFSASGEVEGVWFAPSPAVDETGEEATEAPLPEGVTQEEVEVGEYALPGLVTVPSEESMAHGPQAVVLLVAGSGPNDMDETIGAAGNAPLRDLAHQLAAEGIPSLRYDKRFHADPALVAEDETIQGEVLDDVTAALDLLASHPVAADRDIVVVGHSLGGMLVPAIVTENPGVAGAAILAGTPRSLWDVILDQNAAVIEQSGADEAAAAEQMQQVEAEIDRANSLTDPGADPVFGSLPAAYVVSLNELNLAEIAQTLRIPLLVLQGDADFQISADRDFEAWKEVLVDVPDVTYQLFPGLNHLFMETTGAEDMTDYDEPNVVAPEVSEAIVDWMTERW